MNKISRYIPNRYIFLLITLLIFFHVINNYNVLTASSLGGRYDSITYFKITSRLLNDIKKVEHPWELPGMLIKQFFSPRYQGNRSPLFAFLGWPFIYVKMNMNWAVMSNIMYLCLLLFATYGIGKRLYNPEIGMIAACFVSLFPAIFAMSRLYMMDIAMASFVALTFYFFIGPLRANSKKSFIVFLLTSFCVAIGVLIKESYIYFLPFLLLFLLIKKEYRNTFAVRALGAIFLGLFFASVWYLKVRLNLNYIIAAWQATLIDCVVSHDIFFYFKELYYIQLMPIFFWLSVISLAYYFIKRDLLPIALVILPLMVFSLSSYNKNGRFILPVFTFIALMIGKTIWEITRNNKLIISTLFVLSFLQFFFVTYNIDCRLPFIKLLNFPGFELQENGLFGIVKMPNYRNTTQTIIEVIDGSNAYQSTAEGVNILVLVEEEKQELYFTMEELSVSKIRISNIERPFRYEDTKCIIRSGRKPETEVMGYYYIVCEKAPSFAWKHAQDYYRSFLENKEKFMLINTVSHSPEIQFEIFMRNPNYSQD